MTGLILMSCRQRLLQVGTCVTAPSLFRSSRSRPGPVSSLRNYCCCSYHEISGGPFGRRRIYTAAGPLGVPALARRGAVVEEVQKLLSGHSKGVETGLENVKNKAETVITVPLSLEKRLERKVERESTKRAQRQRIIDASRKGRKSQIVIHCKKQEFNHYKGQSYGKKDDVPLASAGWRHRRSGGDFFTLFPGFKKESPFYMSDTDQATFTDLGICQALCDNLKGLGIEQPTHIQMFGIPQVLKGGRNVVAAETGCGKTLVYLLPMINQILEDKRYKVRPKPGHPTAVIIVPSRELADQIYGVALQLCCNLDVSVKLLQGGSLGSKLKNPPTSKTVDILIATTNALKVLTSAGVYGTSRILHLVLDEADTLLDDSFFPELVAPFLHRVPWDDLQRQVQLTLVSATMPKGLYSTLGQILKVDSFHHCTTPGLNNLLPHVPQTFLRLRKSKKAEKIKEIVQKDVENKIPVIIFCNKSATCDWLSHFLNDEGIQCASVHGRMPLRYRRGRIEMYKNGELDVLISTDLASRGIDTVKTQHVINYEFPLFMADYIHRCGRTGRVGSARTCRVTNFISRPGEVQTVNDIERSVRKEKSPPDVNANIKRLYGQRYGSFVEIQPIRDDDEQESEPEIHSDSESELEQYK